MHAFDEVFDVRGHHVNAVVDRNLDRLGSELRDVLFAADGGYGGFLALLVMVHHFGNRGDVFRGALELAVVHHNDGPFVPANQARDVLRVRHGGAQTLTSDLSDSRR